MNEEKSTTYRMPPEGATVEEVLEHLWRCSTKSGTDLDLLQESMVLIQAGYYREALHLANQALPSLEIPEKSSEEVSLLEAQEALLAANERARPLYEQAAFEIEGKVEGSITMANVLRSLEQLRRDRNW